MKYLIIIIIIIAPLLIAACSTPIVTMPENNTIQLHDLSDEDSDGVITSREKCTGTFSGSQVDNYGCGTEVVNKVRQELNVNFANNSSIVQKRYYADIEVLADFMNAHPETDVIIEGHTSILGSKSLNMSLSQDRAQAIMNILVNTYGIAISRVSAIGYGFDRVIDEARTKEAHAKNRRIVAELTSENITKDMKWNIYSVDK